MKKCVLIICTFMCMIILLNSCQTMESIDDLKTEEIAKDLVITNGTSMNLNSIALQIGDDEENILLSGRVSVNETVKFSLTGEVTSVTVTLNPSDSFSISKELNLTFGDDNILKYKIGIERNEVVFTQQED